MIVSFCIYIAITINNDMIIPDIIFTANPVENIIVIWSLKVI
jgi:hypothetical protein